MKKDEAGALPRSITASKTGNFSQWYDQTIAAARILDKRYAVKGMFVWLPYGYKIMKHIKHIWDGLFCESGIEETYFPQIVPLSYARQNDSWLDGFRNQAYWVKGLDDSDSHHILRPTGEPAMYPLFALWIRTHADLPIRIYETVSSFRYETRMTRPLIRDREITMWYEIHTAHETKEEADAEIKEAIRMNDIIWHTLALPTIKVEKPAWECFPGAVGAIEYYNIMPDGRALENGSCNNLGQAYAKKFNIAFKDKAGKKRFVWQTCTGNGARYLVAVIAIHGDNRGLVLPPEIAPIQAVITTISARGENEKIIKKARDIARSLQKQGLCVSVDDRDKNPGEKFFEWEIKGIPVRIEVGPKDLAAGEYIVYRRDTGEKRKIKESQLSGECADLLETIQKNLLKKAREFYEQKIVFTNTIGDIEKIISEKKVVKANWCLRPECWDKITGVAEGIEILGALYEETKPGACIACGTKTSRLTYISKTY